MWRGVQHVQNVAIHLRFGVHATLRVPSSANTALQLVPGATAKLLQRFVHSKVFFESLPTREIVLLLVAEEPVVAISSAPLDHLALEVRDIGKWTLQCVVPKGHALLAKKFDLATALRQRLIIRSSDASQRSERFIYANVVTTHSPVSVLYMQKICREFI